MDWLRAGGRAATAGFAVVFVPLFLAAVLIQNLGNFLRTPLPFHREAADLLGALGADQYWTLFGAYFPPHVRVPVVQLTLQGGHRIFLSPTVSPAFSDAFASTYSLRDLSDPDLVARWRPNFGTGRIEKLEARAGGLAPSGLAVRTGYTAARVRRWANAAPDLAARVRFVDLLSVGIRSAHDGRPPTVFSVDPASIEAGGVDDWPVARTRQLFDVRR